MNYQMNKQKLIQRGKEQLIEQQLKKYSLVNLFRSTICFIPVHVWLLQIGIISWMVILRIRPYVFNTNYLIIQYLTFAVLMSVLFFVSELFKSFTCGVAELEGTLKYDLRQLTLMKLIIFGSGDIFLILLLSWFYTSLVTIPFGHLLLFLFVPYHLICILLLTILTFWRDKISNNMLWIGTSILLMMIMTIILGVDVYQLKIVYWLIAYGVTGFVVVTLLTIQIKGSSLEGL